MRAILTGGVLLMSCAPERLAAPGEILAALVGAQRSKGNASS